MEPGPEGHPGIEREDDVAGRPAMAPPGRSDHEPASDPEDGEVRLPGVGPVLLVDDPGLERTDRAQPEGGEMAERGLGSRHALPGRGRVAGRQVGPDDRRTIRVDPGAKTFLNELEGGFDRRPAGREPGQDLADGLDGLGVGRHRQLEPGALRRGALVGRSGIAQDRASLTRSRIPLPFGPTASPASAA